MLLNVQSKLLVEKFFFTTRIYEFKVILTYLIVKFWKKGGGGNYHFWINYHFWLITIFGKKKYPTSKTTYLL